MALTYFTVVGNYFAAAGDGPYDAGDPDLVPMSGTVTFTPLITTGDTLEASTLTPPTNLLLAPVKVQVKHGKIQVNGEDGVRLPADTSALNLDSNLFYRVDFKEGLVARGATYSLKSFTFQAPNADVVLDLVGVTPTAGQPASGITKIAPGGVRLDVGNNVVFSFAGVDIPDPIPAGEFIAAGVVSDEVSVQVPPAVSAEVAAQNIPGQIAATVAAEPTVAAAAAVATTTAAPAAVTADLASRSIGFVDEGGGAGHFTVGGVPVSGTLVPPAATWSSLGGKELLFDAAKNTYTGKVEWNWFPFANPFDSQVYIASLAQDPVVGTQSIYAIHRVTGDAHKEIPLAATHDAVAAELYATEVTNGGSLCAFEATCVVDGAGTDIDQLISGVFNARVTDTPTAGTVGNMKMVFVDQIPPIPAGVTIGIAYSLMVLPQLVGTENYSLWVDGGDSVLAGRILPKTSNTFALRLSARSDTDPTTTLMLVEGPSGEFAFRVTAGVTAAIGPDTVADSTFSINNVYSPGKVALNVQQSGSQTANPIEVARSSGVVTFSVDVNGGITSAGNPVGVKVAVPASSTAAGLPGQWAADSAHIYVYTGDGGGTHTWVRSTAASW